MEIEITKISVIHSVELGPDLVRLRTTLPGATYPYDEAPVHLSFHAAAGQGVAYVVKHFNEMEVMQESAEITIFEKRGARNPITVKGEGK